MADREDEIKLGTPAELARRLNEQGLNRASPGRPRTKRPAYEMAAAKAAVNGEKIAGELIAQALDRKDPKQQLAAIKLLFEQERFVRSERREDERFAHLAGDELNQALLQTLRELTDLPEFDAEGTAEELDGGDPAEIFAQD
jgi:hypothetical protein